MSARGHCILSHGFESGPEATKVTALAEAAERLGWSHERPDYTDLDGKREVSPLGDVAARVERRGARESRQSACTQGIGRYGRQACARTVRQRRQDTGSRPVPSVQTAAPSGVTTTNGTVG